MSDDAQVQEPRRWEVTIACCGTRVVEVTAETEQAAMAMAIERVCADPEQYACAWEVEDCKQIGGPLPPGDVPLTLRLIDGLTWDVPPKYRTGWWRLADDDAWWTEGHVAIRLAEPVPEPNCNPERHAFGGHRDIINRLVAEATVPAKRTGIVRAVPTAAEEWIVGDETLWIDAALAPLLHGDGIDVLGSRPGEPLVAWRGADLIAVVMPLAK